MGKVNVCVSQEDISPVDVDTISNELKISKSFLAKILQNLAKDGVLKSFKGANGGFALNGEPENLSIKKIIECAFQRILLSFLYLNFHKQSVSKLL